jgi:ankyrin repeat protein/tetratricopeptide (TPR) repeat protein
MNQFMKLKSWILALMLALATVGRAATNDLTGLLQKGLFEEEANRDLTAAIANYQSLASAFDKDRQLAATAIFRLGECYRKLGKTNEAVVQYERIVKEFADQQTLVTLSRQNLSGLSPSTSSSIQTSASIGELRSALTRAQAEVAKINAFQLNSGTNHEVWVGGDKTLISLMQDQQALKERLNELRTRYTDTHPQVQSVQKKIEANQEAIETRSRELVTAAHRSLDLAQKAYDQKLIELDLASPPANSTYDSEVAQAETTAATLQAQLGEITKMPPDQARIFVQQNYPNPVLTESMTQLVNAERDLIKLKSDYTPDHPKYQNAKELVDNLNAKVDAQVEGVIQSLRGKLAVAQVQRDLLRRRQSEMTGITGGGGGSSESATTEEEQQEIRRIQLMIQNSPDLINAPGWSGDVNNSLTPLIAAATKGQLAVAKYLLDHGADVNGRASNGGSVPLLAAAENGHKAMVELLLARGADVSGKGLNPLYEAVAHGFTGVAEVLIASNADVNLPCGTATGGRRPLHAAVRSGRPELIQLLLTHGADVNATDDQGQTPLEYTVDYAGMQDPIAAAKLLIAAKASVDAQDKTGNTPLHVAAKAGNVALVSLLLNSGAAVDPTNNEDTTPLLLAVVAKKVDAVRVLLEHKANPNRKGLGTHPTSPNMQVRELPVFFAIWNNSTEILKSLLDAGANPEGDQTSRIPLFAAIDHNANDATKILLEHKADPNHAEKGYPALNHALRARRDSRLIALLLDHGADPNLRDIDDYLPLFWSHDPEISRLLIAHKADVNGCLKSGYTALMSAVTDTNCLKVLLENGANPDLQETNGNTALHWAVENSQPIATALLLEAKANPNIQNSQGYTPLDLAEAGQKGANIWGMLNPNPGISGQIPPRDVQREIAEALVKGGALANLPKRNHIEVRRGANTRFIIYKDSQDRNRFSLFEVIASSYDILTQQKFGSWGRDNVVKSQIFARNSLPFPDFKKVTVYRGSGNSGKQTTIKMDLENALNTADCSRDSMLEWGDVVEIPEADHPVDLEWPGLADQVVSALTQCTSREVTIKINNETTKLKLAAEYVAPPRIMLTRASFMLRSVLDNSGLIRVSSDLSHVKVTRTDPTSKKTTEWTIDCTDNNQPGLWLRDGDVIEVPEKQ